MPAANRKTGTKKATGKTGAKKTQSARSTAKRRPDKRTLAKKKQFFSGELKVIVTAAVGLFLFLSNFGIMGEVGNFFAHIELGLFGLAGYVFPLLLLSAVVLYVKNQGSFLAVTKLGSALLMIIILSALMQLLFGKEQGLDPAVYYGEAVSGALSGGAVGGVCASALRSLTGTIGAYLILIVLLIICMVFVTERSFVSAARSGMEKTAHAAREGQEWAREAALDHRQRREEARERRRENARGVDFGATLLGGEAGAGSLSEERLADAARLYAGYGRELMGDQPGLADVDDGTGHGPLRKISHGPLDDSCYDTQILGDKAASEADFSTDAFSDGTVSAEGMTAFSEPDYEDDSVPFEETEEDVYKSYRFDQQREGLRLSEAGHYGYAAGTGLGARESRPERAGMNAFRRLEEGETAAAQEETQDIPEEFAEPELYGETPEPEAASEEDLSSEEMEGAGTSFGEVSGDRRSPEAHRTPEDRQSPEAHRIPEEHRQAAVTASGKPLEDTSWEADEILQKKLGGSTSARAEEPAAPAEPKKAEAPTAAENKAVAAQIQQKAAERPPYQFPPLRLLKKGPRMSSSNQQELRETAAKLQHVLQTFGVGVKVTNASRGPSVTRYELTPDVGVKVSRITSLSDDIKLALAAADIRIEAPIPGKAAVGIEVPNKDNSMVYFRDIIDTEEFRQHRSHLAFAIGKDIAGKTVIGDLAKMPHLLIAGATGSGKSVGINTLIMSLLYKSAPEDVRMIMIDPKVVELSVYNGIPHLLIPVVTDPKKAASALNWAVAEMTQRYKKFAETGVRDLKGYNQKAQEVRSRLQGQTEAELPAKMPQIVIIIDELADLMMVAPGEVEDAIIRLTQLARAAGIHLVIATQRPSVNVITGLIKANVPSRIAFKTASGTDSRTILDMNGAEKLLGSGDMLFFPSGAAKPSRVQGSFVSDGEVQAVVDFLTSHGEADYSDEIGNALLQESGTASEAGGGSASAGDEYFADAGRLIIEKEKASIGMLQRMFKIGFNRAARIMDQLAEAGVVGPEEGTKPRKILMTKEAFEEFLRSME